MGPALAPGDPEIEDLDLIDAAAGEEQVARLEIAVDDAAGVGRAERLGDSRRELDRLADRERRAGEAGLEVLAVEPLHHQEPRPVGGVAVGDVADDPRMRHLREQLDLAREPRGVVRSPVGDDLDGHRLAGLAIARAEDLPHAARSDLLLDLEPVAVAEQVSELHRSSDDLRRPAGE